jgi:hypothetical protein
LQNNIIGLLKKSLPRKGGEYCLLKTPWGKNNQEENYEANIEHPLYNYKINSLGSLLFIH